MARSHLTLGVTAALAASASADTVHVFDSYPITNSQSAWSASGTQGQNGWTYGFYNAINTAADTGTFNAFVNPTHWNGTIWDHSQPVAGSVPWTEVGQLAGHPNNNGGEFWAVRRFETPANVRPGTTVDAFFEVRKTNLSNDGVSAIVLHEGVAQGKTTIAGNNGSFTGNTASFPTSPGDTIDLALSPQGLTNRSDGSDGSEFRMTLAANHVTTYDGMLIADSVADWSTTGTQGENGWSYGFYDYTNDGDSTYQAGDLNLSHPSFNWTGSNWDWTVAGNPPWTTISQTGGHPNGTNHGAAQPEDNDEHWVVRRYTVQPGEAGDIALQWNLSTGGPGTSGYIFHNGTQLDFFSTSGGTSILRSLLLTGVGVGDTIDIALSPEGPTGNRADSSDTSSFGMQLFLVPEPSYAALLALGALGIISRRRRRP